MNLFIFGLGYSSAAFVARHGGKFTSIAATMRSAEKASRIAQQGAIRPLVLSDTEIDPALPGVLAQADVILVSVLPDAQGDPVLRQLGAEIAAMPSLARIVYLSTIGVYGDHKGAWIDEDTPPNPVAGRSNARLAAEQEWAACAAARGIPLDILRLSGIYGPGRNPLVALANGTARRIIKPGQIFNRIYVHDIADACAACIDKARPGAIYNVTDDKPAPPQDVVLFAAEILGVPPPPETDFFKADLSPMARSFYGENKRVSNARIKRELGFAFAYPTYREGLRALFASGEGRASGR